MTHDRSSWPTRLILAVCGLGTGTWVFFALAQSPGADLPRHVVLFLVSFAFYFAAVVVVLSAEKRVAITSWILALALLWAVILRLLLLGTSPSLSDDIFRYVWDGKVANAGISPYAFAPSAPELAGLRDSLWNGINHKSMSTPYPPLAELLFAAAYKLRPDSLSAMQLLAILFDLGLIAVLLAMLRRLRMNPGRVLVYAWNPLVLVQFAHSGHFDPAMLLPLLGAIFALAANRRVLSGILLGASMLVKIVPAAAGPLFLPLWGVPSTIAAAAVLVAGAIPMLGTPALSGVFSEASDARFNDSAGYLLLRLSALVSPDPETVSRAAAAAILAICSLVLAWRLWRSKASWVGVLNGTYFLFGLFVLLNAVVEPWYFAWIVPFLCFALPPAGRAGWLAPSWGWLLASGLAILTDLTYRPGFPGSGWIWVRAAEYGPLYLLLALRAWTWWTSQRRAEVTGAEC